jgi:hypothetical protein
VQRLSDQEFLSIHDQIRDAMDQKTAEHYGTKRIAVKEYQGTAQTDMEQIMAALKLIMQKLTELDSFVRDKRARPGMYERGHD